MEDITMKKTYISPSMVTVKIAVTRMLAASDRGFVNDYATVNEDNDYDD